MILFKGKELYIYFSKPKLTELCCLKNSAAFSSALPPISPINMIPSVAGSFRKISRQSVKSVPLKGSPPIPGKVKEYHQLKTG